MVAKKRPSKEFSKFARPYWVKSPSLEQSRDEDVIIQFLNSRDPLNTHVYVRMLRDKITKIVNNDKIKPEDVSAMMRDMAWMITCFENLPKDRKTFLLEDTIQSMLDYMSFRVAPQPRVFPAAVSPFGSMITFV